MRKFITFILSGILLVSMPLGLAAENVALDTMPVEVEEEVLQFSEKEETREPEAESIEEKRDDTVLPNKLGITESDVELPAKTRAPFGI